MTKERNPESIMPTPGSECDHTVFLRFHTVSMIRELCAIDKELSMLVNLEVELAAKQYGWELEEVFYPGYCRCPDCESEVVLAIADNPSRLLFAFPPDQVEEFIHGMIKEKRHQKNNSISRFRYR